MTDRRKQLIAKLMLANPSEAEQKLIQLTIERICVDMADFFKGFYTNEGPGAIVYVPRAENQEDTMFYLTVNALMNALNDFNSRDMEGPAEVMKKTIARAESVNPEKEALFIIQDEKYMSLIHYKRDSDTTSAILMR
jgi:hypothetical protein